MKEKANGALELLYDEDDYGRLKCCTIFKKLHIVEIFRLIKERQDERR